MKYAEITAVLTQDPEYPAVELLRGEAHPRGWQTAM